MHTGHVRKSLKSYCLHGRQGYAERMWAATSSFSKVSVLDSIYTEMQPQSLQTKTGSEAFSKVSFSRVENTGVCKRQHSKSSAF